MSLQTNDVLELRPEKLVAGGDSLTRVDGFPIFVPGIFPGDRASVRIVEVKKGFARGELVAIVEPGPQRRSLPCPIADECGGCDWTALRLDLQLEWKKTILLETLRRIGKIDESVIPDIRIHASPLNYRIRSRLHVDHAREKVGFFAMRSHHVVDVVKECEVLGPRAIERLDDIKADALQSSESMVSMFETGEDIVVETHDGDPEGTDVEMQVGAHKFRFSTASFFQVNRHLLVSLTRRVSEIAERCSRKSLALDLYGGVGFFASALREHFEEVVTVEAEGISQRAAQYNAESDVTAVGSTVERFLHRNAVRADMTMLDPPRAGASPDVIEHVAEKTRELICYLSCDPVTFARDASRLSRRGWRLASIEIFDLFPNTHHIETLSSFLRERDT